MSIQFDPRELGRYGEQLAKEFLIASGYRFISSNWWCRQGEVDLIVWDAQKRMYVFCEVKTRRNLEYGHPLESISAKKLSAIFSVANVWKKECCIKHMHYRIDALSIYWLSGFPEAAQARIEHLKEIFVCH